jgi:hypothetical protein
VVTTERAEAAVLDAHVGEVDVAIDHVRDGIAGLTAPELVGHHREGGEVAPGGLGQHVALGHRDLASVERAIERDAHLA